MAEIGGPLQGTAGNDFLIGTAGELDKGVDNSANSGVLEMAGFGGDDIMVGDIFHILGFDTEGDVMRGGEGNDLIYGDTAPDLSKLGISSPLVGDTNWAINGNSDTLYGDAGNDLIYGSGGFDTIYGGIGNDRIYGQQDGDYLYGDEGKDRVYGGHGNDQVYGGAGADTVFGDDGNDGLYGEAFGTSKGDGGDTMKGGAGNDDIRGGAGADTLYGDSGDDSIEGGGLYSDSATDLGDSIFGGTGNDVISGHYGADVINGGAGADDLYGGQGGDLFVYSTAAESRRTSADEIFDFTIDSDVINLQAIDAIAGGLDDAFIYRGSKAFTSEGQVRVYSSALGTIVDVNIEGTSGAEMRIVIKNGAALDQNDFLL